MESLKNKCIFFQTNKQVRNYLYFYPELAIK